MSNTLSVENLSQSLQKFPEFLRASDLIKLGLYSGRASVTVAKRLGKSPPHIKLSSHKVVFPRAALIAWLLAKTSENAALNQGGSADDSNK